MRFLGRWILRIILVLAAATLAAYAVDSAVYIMRGSPTSTVKVSRFMSVPLKGNKVEYDFLGSYQEPCSRSLFPHGGQDPCWHLRRYPDQWENL